MECSISDQSCLDSNSVNGERSHICELDCNDFALYSSTTNASVRSQLSSDILGDTHKAQRYSCCAKRLPDSKLLSGVFGKDGKTALHLASQIGCVKSLLYLLSRRCSVNALDRLWRTPFHIACLHNNMHCAAILLQNGADVNALDNFNRTALHHAACSDSNYAVDFLLSHGAAISTRDAFGRTPLHAACHSNSHNFLTHVLKTVRHIDLESQDYNGSTPLHLAAQSSEIDCLAILLNLGVNTEASDAHHRTPLHIATKNPGGYNSAKLLLAYGASTGALSRDLQMPLHMACARGDANIIQMYLDFGAVVSVHDCLKITPLHIASERGNLAVIHMLLCHLSKCFAANDFVYSENSYFDRVSMGIPSPTFKGILGYAELNRVIRLTLNSIQSGGLHQGAIRTTLDLTDQCGDTPLHKACMQKKLSAVIFLIFVGASATKVNRSGLSPLDILAAKSPSMYRYAASFCEWFSKTPLLIVLFPRPSRTMSAASTQISSGFRCECDVGRRWPLAYSTLQIDIIKQLVLEYLA